jgi:hypothetical protein
MHSKPKMLSVNGKQQVLNCSMMLGLAMDFCEAINSEDAPKIESSV